MKKVLVSLVAMMFLVAFNVHAAPIWGTDASGYLTGERSAGSSTSSTLSGTGDWATNFTIGWNVTNNNGLYTYAYTLSTAVSHFAVELTDGVSSVSSNITHEIKVFSPSDPGNSNPNMPNAFYGVKFDQEYAFYSFTTVQAPVWGNFYAKAGAAEAQPVNGSSGGQTVFNAVWNTGLDFADFKTNEELSVMNFIVRPNGDPVHVPEPSTLLLFGAGIAGLALYRRKRS